RGERIDFSKICRLIHPEIKRYGRAVRNHAGYAYSWGPKLCEYVRVFETTILEVCTLCTSTFRVGSESPKIQQSLGGLLVQVVCGLGKGWWSENQNEKKSRQSPPGPPRHYTLLRPTP